ncbi:unnamed protein product [marine sediment metagenome]|uniref:Uncharacterized protein n=1 Tax=marine sediment metagenome TaxID=412755 RepID=X1ILF6_9ZZZZ
MDKLTNLKEVKRYWCSECEHFHIRKYKYIINEFGKRIKTKNTPFFNHKEFAFKLTSTEIFNMKFQKSTEKYSIKAHKKTSGSMKQ